MKNYILLITYLLLNGCGGGNDDGNLDDNTANPGNIHFTSSSYAAIEGDDSFLVTITREDGRAGNVSVDYNIISGTATLDMDYSVVQQRGSVSFGEGEKTKTIVISIVDDSETENNETIILQLLNPAGGAEIVSPSNTTLNIIDNESAGIIEFPTSTLTFNESVGATQVVVARSNGAASGVSVDYLITPGTATPGIDYDDTVASGTLVFANGELSKTIDILIFEDTIQESTESLVVTLSNPLGGVSIGAQSNLNINISDNDSSPNSGTSILFVENINGQQEEYAQQTVIPNDFGSGEFTFQIWLKMDVSYPVGSTHPVTGDQQQNWSEADPQPYSAYDWWWRGNFLLDGHNNSQFQNGTFSIQVYGGGRIRWLFGDGASRGGGPWAVQAYPATTTSSLLDDNWHQVTLVRRWVGISSAQLELWVDDFLVATETSDRRTDMRTYWDAWNGFTVGQEGWFWGVEKYSALSSGSYEDYKGLIDEIRFWSSALSNAEIVAMYQQSVTGSEPSLVGVYHLDEGAGNNSCNMLNDKHCITMIIPPQDWVIWEMENAPLL